MRVDGGSAYTGACAQHIRIAPAGAACEVGSRAAGLWHSPGAAVYLGIVDHDPDDEACACASIRELGGARCVCE